MHNKTLLNKIAEASIGAPIARYKHNELLDKSKFKYKILSQNMFDGSGIICDFTMDTFISNKNLDDSCTQEGDIVYGMRKPNDAIYISSKYIGVLVPSYMAIIRCTSSKVVPEYLAYKLNTTAIQQQLYKHIQGAAIPLLKVVNLREVEVDLPSKEQQQKIIEVVKTGYKEINTLKELITEKTKILKSIL